MKFGLFHTVQWPAGSDQRQRMRDALTEAIYAEELGYESVWMTEHHFTGHGITGDNLGLLSYLAASTERIRLGPAVSVLPFHNPLRLAEAAATVDLLSDGRFDFGIGRGYQWAEYHGFGLDLAEGGAMFDESIDLITKAWTADAPFNHNGKYWHFEDVNVLPRPLQQPHPPIWMGTGSPAGLRRCAENDWGVMLGQGLSISAVAEVLTTYRQALADLGKPYDPAKFVVARAAYVDRDDATAWDIAGPVYATFRENVARLSTPPGTADATRTPFDVHEDISESAIFGSPDTSAASLRRLEALGVEYVILFTHMGGLRHEQTMQTLELFAHEVAPRLAEAKTPRS